MRMTLVPFDLVLFSASSFPSSRACPLGVKTHPLLREERNSGLLGVIERAGRLVVVDTWLRYLSTNDEEDYHRASPLSMIQQFRIDKTLRLSFSALAHLQLLDHRDREQNQHPPDSPG